MTDEATPADTAPARGASASGEGGSFPIVAIGMSAGGLRPLRTLLESLPAAPGMAFVVVQHLDPTRKSLLAEILGRSTALTVVPIRDGLRVRPDRVYVIPPDSYLVIRDGVLRRFAPDAPRGRRRPIDVFFHSLADDAGEPAVCVLLSGADDDGSSALERVKSCGGMVIAQDPQTAEHDTMPRQAIATGLVDRVLAPEAIGGELRDLTRIQQELDGAPPIAERDRDSFAGILALLNARLRLDFRQYKKATVSRRIARRMALHHLAEGHQYLRLLGNDPRELEALGRDVLIKVTRFFREPEAWDCLAGQALPQLVDQQQGDVPLRAWVPGCSTGEEAYTLAMLLVEAFEAAGRKPEIQLFASDLDRGALDVARSGRYPVAVLHDVGAARAERFFERENETVRVTKQLRDCVVFAFHDVGLDPPFSHLDLITCRNLLIYLEPEMQDRILGLFHFALRRDRFLMLGSAESLGGQRDLFDVVSKRHRIVRRVGPARRDRLDFPVATGSPVAGLPVPRPLPWRAAPKAALGAGVIGAGVIGTGVIGTAAIDELESALRLARDELRLSVERHESSDEALRASHEEVMSINEELHSTNEELETSKEELQSINEELSSVNQQLEAQNAELAATSDDLRNLLVSTDIATLFLDREMCIRRFTPAMGKLLHLIPGDLARPLADITARFDKSALVADAERVLATLTPVENEMRSNDGAWFIRRVLPFRTEDDRIGGVVATFTDVTTRKQVEEQLRQLNESLGRRVEERAGYLSLILEVTVIANQTDDVDRAIAAAVEKICDHTGWLFCRVFLAADEGAAIHFRQQLRRADVPVDEAPREPPRRRTPSPKSLVGQVAASRRARWTRRLAETSLGRGSGTPPRVAAASAFPILVRDQVVGVLEFFAENGDEAEDELLQVMVTVGTQLGRVIERRRALRELAEAVWSEQRRAGQELHDTIGQQLVGVAMMARALEGKLSAGGHPEAPAAKELVAEAQLAHRRVRTLSKGLYPAVIEEGGEDLESALDDLCGVTRERFDVDCEIELGADLPRLDAATASQLFHIAREAVLNAANHGAPDGIVVRLRRVEEVLRLEVEDDGAGFEGEPESLDGMGLRIMRYRAGVLGGSLELAPGRERGCVLRVEIPLEDGR